MHVADSVKIVALFPHCSLPQSVIMDGAMLSFSTLFSKFMSRWLWGREMKIGRLHTNLANGRFLY